MRITTGILNRHNGGGLIPGRKSLLGHLQSGKTGGSSRLDAMKAKGGKNSSAASAAAARYTGYGYDKLESVSSRYNAGGDIGSSYFSRYNFLG